MFEWLTKQEEPPRPVLDTEYLDRLGQHLGSQVTGELIADGLIELSDRIERLEALARDGNATDVAKLAHDMAGMSGHLGLSRLSQLCAALNREVREKGAVTAVTVAPTLEVARVSVAALGDHLAGPAASPQVGPEAGTGT